MAENSKREEKRKEHLAPGWVMVVYVVCCCSMSISYQFNKNKNDGGLHTYHKKQNKTKHADRTGRRTARNK